MTKNAMLRGCGRSGALAARLLPLLLAAGCGAEASMTPEEVVSEAEFAITNTDYTDGTGTIRVRVKTCDFTAMATANCAYCVVDSGWSRVGGGAEIIDETGSAQLKASYPGDDDFPPNCTGTGGRLGEHETAWIARSAGATHRLRSYVIGLQIKDASGNWLAPRVSQGVDRVTSNVTPPANATVQTTEEDATGAGQHYLVGGGAEVVADNTNALITDSSPIHSPRAWQARDRMQQLTPDGGLKSYAINIDGCPPEWNGDCFTYPRISSTTAASTSGYGTATFTRPASWVMTMVGGTSPTSSGAGRYLNDLIPFNGSSTGFTVRSRAATWASSGPTNGYAILLGRSGASYTFNSVRFNANSTALARATGINPRLQQSIANPDAAPLRFHLERITDGLYRLRNSNPDGGGDCAYRHTDGTVRLAPCVAGNSAYQWTLFSGAASWGYFRLRNVAAGQCLDTNGQGNVTGNVVLKNCSSSAGTQELFLDAYSWPPT